MVIKVCNFLIVRKWSEHFIKILIQILSSYLIWAINVSVSHENCNVRLCKCWPIAKLDSIPIFERGWLHMGNILILWLAHCQKQPLSRACEQYCNIDNIVSPNVSCSLNDSLEIFMNCNENSSVSRIRSSRSSSSFGIAVVLPSVFAWRPPHFSNRLPSLSLLLPHLLLQF